MFHKSSSRKVLIERRASYLSWIGRISERITSLEREERYWGPGEASQHRPLSLTTGWQTQGIQKQTGGITAEDHIAEEIAKGESGV